MATIFLDYDSKGDVHLILEEKDGSPIGESSGSASAGGNNPRYAIGLLGVKMKKVQLRVSSLKLNLFHLLDTSRQCWRGHYEKQLS
jgi:hypothetical protein